MTVASRPYAVHANGPRTSVRYTPGSAYRAGDVVVVGTTTLVADMDNPPNAQDPVVPAAALYFGGVYKMKADGAISPGADVWWDDTNKKVTLTASGNTHFGKLLAGPDELASGAGTATDLDAAWVLHCPQIAVGGALSTPITSTSANALAVGRQGATNPVFDVDASTSTVTTGIKVKGAADGGGVAITAISSNANEAMTIDAKGTTGTMGIGTVTNGAITIGSANSASLTFGVEPRRPVATVAVGGTAIGNANAVGEGFTYVTGANDTAAVVLPASVAGKRVQLKNSVGNKILIVFPPVSSQVNANGANNAYNMAAGSVRDFVCYNSTLWLAAPETIA